MWKALVAHFISISESLTYSSAGRWSRLETLPATCSVVGHMLRPDILWCFVFDDKDSKKGIKKLEVKHKIILHRKNF